MRPELHSKEDLLDKTMAYWDRVLVKEVINKALQDAVDKHEKRTEI
jgi:hypothetical protein